MRMACGWQTRRTRRGVRGVSEKVRGTFSAPNGRSAGHHLAAKAGRHVAVGVEGEGWQNGHSVNGPQAPTNKHKCEPVQIAMEVPRKSLSSDDVCNNAAEAGLCKRIIV